MIVADLEFKVLNYLERRKTPSTIKQISKMLIRSDSYTKNLLSQMKEKNLITSIRFGSITLYLKNEDKRHPR